MRKSLRSITTHSALIASLVGLLAASACSGDGATAPSGSVYVTVSPTWIAHATVADVNGSHARFAVDATIHNDGATDVQLTPIGCESPIERRSGSRWVPAITGGFCVAQPAPPVNIPAHTVLARHFDVNELLPRSAVPDVPAWNAPSATGMYRIHFDLATPGPALTLLGDSESASPPFVILD